MNIAILGGSGFIGKQLATYLVHQGHKVQIWSRTPQDVDVDERIECLKWPLDEAKSYPQIEAIVNLAGESINQRWTAQSKQRIMNSRIETTHHVLQLIRKKIISPRVLVNGSAVGYYGASQQKTFTEEAQPQHDFLSQVCLAWEHAADQIQQFGVRCVKIRIGLVLGREGGAFPKMVLPFKLFVGGSIGSGKQWVSWIHVHDLARAIEFALTQDAVEGAVNCTAPQPVRMKQFGQSIAKQLKRPFWFPVPAFGLRLLLGEMASLLVDGQKVLPQQLETHGFTFQYPQIESALADLLASDGGGDPNV